MTYGNRALVARSGKIFGNWKGFILLYGTYLCSSFICSSTGFQIFV